MSHTHECPSCRARWECGEANYQDECPYPTEILCIRCWARLGARDAEQAKAKAASHKE